MTRITRDELFFRIAQTFSERSTCPRAAVGAVIVRERHIVAHGYNGAPPGQPHCDEVGCAIGPDEGCLNSIHAEANAIVYAARGGFEVYGSTLYCTHEPCIRCAQLIIAAGIQFVMYQKPYRLGASRYLMERGVSCVGK